jgi:membrane fusion protein, multidrug efflux system
MSACVFIPSFHKYLSMIFPRSRHLSSFVLVIIMFAALVVATGCSKKDSSSSSRKGGGLKFPVEVATVATRGGSMVVNAVGSVEAFEIVQVTARVSGAVEKVRFKEGQRVKASDPLIEIEPERFALAVRTAEAAYERAKAARREAQAGLARRIGIQENNPGFMSPEELSSWETKALASQADSAQAAADLELARLNQRDAFVPAPVSGVVQSRSVRTGQYVQAGTLIATMVHRDPLLLRFSVPDQEAQRLHTGLDVTFRVRDEAGDHRARITAVAESADPTTRMVAVTAEVIDEKRDQLRPGAFAEVTVLLGEGENFPVIPQISIRPSEKGFLAYVVADSVAHERIVTLGLQSPDGYVEVRDGLKAGERIVVRGAEALREGAAVRIVSPGGDSTEVKAKRGKKS